MNLEDKANEEAPGTDSRAQEIAKIRSTARRKIGARPGRPRKTDAPGGVEGEAPSNQLDGGQRAGDGTNGSSRPLAPARLDVVPMVDFIKSYHVVGGWVFPEHAHWRDFPDARVQAAAQTLVSVSDKIPEPVRVAMSSWLSMGAVAMSLYEVMAAPMLKSLKLRKDEKERQPEEPAKNGAEQPA